MYFKIHRGTKEIGGSCVEVWTENSRIVIDFGMPLVEKNGTEFSFEKYKNLTQLELIENDVLPNVPGLYSDSESKVDGVLISHAHQDHYGLLGFLNSSVCCYLGEATHKIIEINNLFTSQNTIIANHEYFQKEVTFKIGDISITPYWADHSSFDAYSFLVEANGKSLFYSGDFRGHGRKVNAFKWFIHNAPKNVDYLLLEGTSIGRGHLPFKNETDIENELLDIFKDKDKINLVYTSGQNIDRLVSIYRACIRTGKTLVVDVYVATILKTLSQFAKIQYPSDDFKNLKVIFPYYTSKRLGHSGNEKILYQFKKYKISKEEVSAQKDKIVMVVRPSMQKDLEHIAEVDGGNLIYSMWEGYKSKPNTKEFIDYLTSRNFNTFDVHTSGHADEDTLKQFVSAIKPKFIMPIHTFNGNEYHKLFLEPIIELKDGEIIGI